MSRHPVEPLVGTSNFRVLIGMDEISIAHVTRLSSVTQPAEPDGGQRDAFETVVLRRALSRSTALFDWRRRVAEGHDDRRDVTIELLDCPGGSSVSTWRLIRARPLRWSGPALDALASEVACEELELAFDDLVWLLAQPKTRSGHRSRPVSEGA